MQVSVQLALSYKLSSLPNCSKFFRTKPLRTCTLWSCTCSKVVSKVNDPNIWNECPLGISHNEVSGYVFRSFSKMCFKKNAVVSLLLLCLSMSVHVHMCLCLQYKKNLTKQMHLHFLCRFAGEDGRWVINLAALQHYRVEHAFAKQWWWLGACSRHPHLRSNTGLLLLWSSTPVAHIGNFCNVVPPSQGAIVIPVGMFWCMDTVLPRSSVGFVCIPVCVVSPGGAIHPCPNPFAVLVRRSKPVSWVTMCFFLLLACEGTVACRDCGSTQDQLRGRMIGILP